MVWFGDGLVVVWWLLVAGNDVVFGWLVGVCLVGVCLVGVCLVGGCW